MKNFKKFLTLVLAVMMVVSSFAFSTSAATTKFEDVDAKNETLVKAVDLLSYMGVAKGTSDTTFGADELVTRQQFALFIYRLMKGGKDAPANASNTTKFTDLTDATYFYAISWANAEGIVNGKSATTFGPKDPIKLQEAYAMIVRALDWEEENDLVYPYGHIEVAEQEGVELDAGLASNVGYADELTRGDMAILLYNAFFAETGIEVVDTKERGLGPWELDDDGVTKIYQDYVLEEYTTNPRLCEKAFEVVEAEYMAVATPNYYLGDNEPTYDLGYDAIYFVEVTEDDTDAPDEVYIAAEDLGIAAEDLNDYFMGQFTMFVTVDDDEIEKVLFADCNMTKKTVTDLKLGEVSSNKAESYFTDSVAADADAKLLSGKITADGEDLYVFNAPYTYAGEAYAAGATAYQKYVTRNTQNIEKISFSMTEEDDQNLYTVEIEAIVPEVTSDAFAADDFTFEAQAEALLTAFYNVYYDGLYQADLYDVDGDGLYDYINYVPYTFFQVDSDEDEVFGDSDFDAEDNDVPYIYTQEATVLGEEFADEDYVIGYFSAELELVNVVAVVKPTVDTISNYKKATGMITLGSGDVVDAVSAWKLLATKEEYDASDIVWDEDALIAAAVTDNWFFSADALDDEEVELYIYDGVLLYSDAVNNSTKYTENLIIPTDIKNVRNSFNSATGEDTWYVYAWVDGTTKYVPVVVEDVYPEIIDEDAEELNAEYLNKLCTYTVDADGVYTISSLGYAVDEDDDFVGIPGEFEDDEDEDAQLYGELAETTITKVAGSRYTVEGLGDVNFNANTKIIIRVETVEDDGDVKYEYVEYDATSFTKSLDSTLENVSYILGNNVKSATRENLVLLYAETDDVKFAGKTDKNGYRIISNTDIGEDAEGEWRLYYELYDPYTGAKVSDVPSAQSAKKASGLKEVYDAGDIIELVDGQVPDDGASDVEDHKIGAIDTANFLWISGYDAADGYITVVPYDGSIECKDCVDVYVEENENAAVTDIYGEEIGKNFIDVDKNTVVSVIKYTNLTSMWNWGTMSLSSVSALENPKNEILCYNEKATDRSGNYKTAYADYVKAYVSVDTDVEEDENPVAEFIIIVVNANEASALDNVCDEH